MVLEVFKSRLQTVPQAPFWVDVGLLLVNPYVVLSWYSSISSVCVTGCFPVLTAYTEVPPVSGLFNESLSRYVTTLIRFPSQEWSHLNSYTVLRFPPPNTKDYLSHHWEPPGNYLL